MLMLSIVLSLLQSSMVFAFDPNSGTLPSKTTLKDGFRIDCYDLNRDSKEDLCFYYDKTNYLAKQETDSNFDGKFEIIESFGSAQKFEYLKINSISSTEKETTVIKEFAGNKFYETTHVKQGQPPVVTVKVIRDQKASKIDCEPTVTERFVKSFKDALVRVKMDKESFYNSDFGLRIHQSCIQKRGNSKAVDEFKSAYQEGLKCLDKLNTVKAREHIAKIQSLFKAEPKPKVICNQQDYNWKGTLAHASTSGSDKDHPIVSMNPHTCSQVASLDYKGTFFHELFHNIGYQHRRDPEYAYSCDACCFGDGKAKNEQCEMCGSSASSIKDPGYLKKWVKIYTESGYFPQPHVILENELIKDPNNPVLIESKLKLYSKAFGSSLGAAYLEKYKSKGIKVPVEIENDITYYANEPYNKPLKENAKSIVDAEANLEAGNYQGAIASLKSIKPLSISANETSDNKEFFKSASDQVNDAEIRVWETILEKSYAAKDFSVAVFAAENQKRLEALKN